MMQHSIGQQDHYTNLLSKEKLKIGDYIMREDTVKNLKAVQKIARKVNLGSNLVLLAASVAIMLHEKKGKKED